MIRVTSMDRLHFKLLLAVGTLAVAVALFSVSGTFVFYTLIRDFVPDFYVGVEKWVPEPLEVAWLTMVIVGGVVLAAYCASRQAAKVLDPLEVVRACLHELSNGNLSARATLVSAPRELRELIDDCNRMAERTERVTNELRLWNAAIAHELRTPVSILLGRVHAIEDRVFEVDEVQLRSLRLQVQTLAKLIENLRMWTLAESGQLRLCQDRIELRTLVEEIVFGASHLLSESGFSASMHVDEVTLVADTSKITQVLIALIDNARRYAHPANLVIGAKLNADVLEVFVEDCGPGLDPAFAAHAFEAFSRGDGSRARSSGGSGLGLAIVRAIAKAHGGRAAYRRSDGGGSVFSATFQVATS